MADAALVDRLRPGDHLCWSFTRDAERRRVAAAYVRAGLRQHQKVIYLPAAVDAGTALDELAGAGLDTGPPLTAGQLVVASADETYLAGGSFDGPRVRQMVAGAVAQARAEGWTALRSLGDMAWGVRDVPGAAGLAAYERDVNRLHADGGAIGLCLYDRRLFGAGAMREVVRAHPSSVTPRTPGSMLPLLRAVRTPAGLCLTGEADLSNRDAVVTVLTHLLEDAPAPVLTLDVTDLEYADATVCRLIVGLARRARGRLRTTGARPPLRRLLALQGADDVPGLLDGP